MNKNLLVPGTNNSILSWPTKMQMRFGGSEKLTQIYSFGLKARTTCPGATYLPGHKCVKCYARKGHFLFPTTKTAQDVRTAWTIESMLSQEGRKSWIEKVKYAFGWATERRNVLYFRQHHGGDFFSKAYIESWHAITEYFPFVKSWTPTSSYLEGCHENAVDVLTDLQPALMAYAAQPNVTVRPSAREIGLNKIIQVDGLAGGTGVITKKEQKELHRIIGLMPIDSVTVCPAKENGNVCGDCRTCWDSPEISGYYPEH